MIDRISKLAQVLSHEGVDAFLACTPITMGYLADLFEDGHERFLALAIKDDGQVRLICPALTTNQARRVGIQDVRGWTDGEGPQSHIKDLLQDWHLSAGIVAVDSEMRADILLELQSVWPAVLFKSGEAILSQLTRKKSGLELELMQRAASIADQAYRDVKPNIRVGMTEAQVANMLSLAMADLGGKPKFAIVATGANGAEPHHLPDETVLRPGDVAILDFGCEVQGYQSDITRVVAIESASERAQKIYDTVFRAHMAGRSQAVAGGTSNNVDLAARSVIEAEGFGQFFVHRTGHGIGMRTHEEPYINPGNDFVLEPGNCFSIEPGIYLPGELGVRIENIVTAREGDCLSLNEEPSPTLQITG